MRSSFLCLTLCATFVLAASAEGNKNNNIRVVKASEQIEKRAILYDVQPLGSNRNTDDDLELPPMNEGEEVPAPVPSQAIAPINGTEPIDSDQNGGFGDREDGEIENDNKDDDEEEDEEEDDVKKSGKGGKGGKDDEEEEEEEEEEDVKKEAKDDEEEEEDVKKDAKDDEDEEDDDVKKDGKGDKDDEDEEDDDVKKDGKGGNDDEEEEDVKKDDNEKDGKDDDDFEEDGNDKDKDDFEEDDNDKDNEDDVKEDDNDKDNEDDVKEDDNEKDADDEDFEKDEDDEDKVEGDEDKEDEEAGFNDSNDNQGAGGAEGVEGGAAGADGTQNNFGDSASLSHSAINYGATPSASYYSQRPNSWYASASSVRHSELDFTFSPATLAPEKTAPGGESLPTDLDQDVEKIDENQEQSGAVRITRNGGTMMALSVVLGYVFFSL